ncbi:hypothetical protein CBR_g49833 [Chara braunii]|uniref:CCHC-type domain-containing protein n=1 Tax=Chara braunii TaxID=69332 RepID=A0A388JP76_CHABU|nr:hypothetical protein CBR_g49833 [Chara braunii]|eukprot:GBG59573.1 hypothetical protein CBR_g49833 [Chara braunii]
MKVIVLYLEGETLTDTAEREHRHLDRDTEAESDVSDQGTGTQSWHDLDQSAGDRLAETTEGDIEEDRISSRAAFRKPLYGDRFLEVSYIYSGGRGRIEILIGASGDITLAEELHLRSVADEEMARCMAYICKIDPAAPLDISYVVPESIATRVLNDEAPDMESQTATLTHEGMKAITKTREGNVEAAAGGNLKAEEILGLLVKLRSFEKLTLPAPATQTLVGAKEGKEERKKEKQKEESESESESSDEEDVRRRRKERQKKKRDRDWKKDNKSRDWQKRDGPFRCYYCDEEGHTLTRCPTLEKKLEEGIIKKNANGHICDANWNKVDFRVKGGMRAVILEKAKANKDKKKKGRVNVITFDGMLPPEIVARDDNRESQNLNVSHVSQKEVEEKKREKAQRELDQLIDGTKDLVKEGKGKEAAGKKRKVVLRSEAKEGISIDEVIKKLLEETEITLSWKEAVALVPKFREELKKMVERRKVEVNSLRLFPQHVERVPPGTKMRFDNMSCGYLNIFVNDMKVRTLVDSEAEMVLTSSATMRSYKLRDGGVVLGVPYFDDERERPFIVEADGGPIALRRVLVQQDENGKEKPLIFESHTFNSVERGYIQIRKELLAILHFLRVFRHYVMGQRFILRTDSTAVIGAVKRHQQVDATVSRWITHIWTYDFVLEKVPTEKNRADGLSRVGWGSIDDESLEEAPFVDEFLMEDDDEGLPPAPSCYTASTITTSKEECWGEKEDRYLYYLLTQEDEEEGWYGMVEQAAVAAHELVESSRMVERRLNEIEKESDDQEQDKDAE